MLQTLLNGVVSGLLVALPAIALSLTYGVLNFPNFAIGSMITAGAYIALFFNVDAGVPALIAAALAIVVTVALNILVALVSARLREDYLAIATLAFAEAVRLFLLNETWVTSGANGLPGIPRPLSELASGLQYELRFLGLSLAVLAACFAFAQMLTVSPFGRVLRALREDDLVTATLGKPRSASASGLLLPAVRSSEPQEACTASISAISARPSSAPLSRLMPSWRKLPAGAGPTPGCSWAPPRSWCCWKAPAF